MNSLCGMTHDCVVLNFLLNGLLNITSTVNLAHNQSRTVADSWGFDVFGRTPPAKFTVFTVDFCCSEMTKLCIADAELHHFSYEVLKALALGTMVLALALASKVQARLSP